MRLWRIIGLSCAVLVAARGVHLTVAAHQLSNLVDGLPIRSALMEVDFSRIGTTEVQLEIPGATRDLVLMLWVEDTNHSPKKTLRGLKGLISIVDQTGKTVFDFQLASDSKGVTLLDSEEYLTAWLVFRPSAGQYVVRVRVDEPAPALAQKKQMLNARHFYWGQCELPVIRFMALAWYLAAIVILALCWFLTAGSESVKNVNEQHPA